MTRKDRTFEVVYKGGKRRPKLELATLAALALAENGTPQRQKPVEGQAKGIRFVRR
ncbi:hypothetical protein [Azospirillum cavernae]|jgi:hypothetical protein|uniref:hypothetical protein n=1 Tax=Azospirillum cavernae TaxID=2320860 RepID=UPI001314F7F5|nr:hypothetical protein [Azospirillum cavernae]